MFGVPSLAGDSCVRFSCAQVNLSSLWAIKPEPPLLLHKASVHVSLWSESLRFLQGCGTDRREQFIYISVPPVISSTTLGSSLLHCYIFSQVRAPKAFFLSYLPEMPDLPHFPNTLPSHLRIFKFAIKVASHFAS